MAMPGISDFLSARNKGQLLIAPYATPTFQSVGHWEEPVLNIAKDKAVIPDNINVSGGEAESQSFITEMTVSFTGYNFNADMVQRMTKSSKTTVTAATQTAEDVVVYAHVGDYMVRTNYLINSALTVTVTGAGGTPTYTVNDDYRIENGRLVIVGSGSSGAIEAAANADPSDSITIEITYTNLAQEQFEGAVNLDEYYSAHLVLNNTAQNNKIITLDLWKVQFEFPDSLPLVQADNTYMQLPVTVSVMSDSTRGNGESAYFRINYQS